MKRYLFLLLPLFCAVFAACGSDPVDTTGSVAGIVKDALTGANLQGASVSIEGYGTKTTGVDGRYQFNDVEMGTYKVAVRCANYQPDEKNATVRVGETTNVDFSLTPAGSSLEVSPLTLDFGTTDTSLSLDIANKGQATMTWQVIEDVDWLVCTPTSGTIQAGRQASVTVTVSRGGLTKGSYTNTLVVTSNDGGSQTVRFNMTVAGGSTSLPQVSLLGVDGVTDQAASFSGTLTSIGSSRVTAYGFCWSMQPNPTLEQGSHQDLGSTDEPKETFTYSIAGLLPNTTYYVRAYATNAEGTVYSSFEERFTTTATPQRPDVETGAATQVTSSGAVVAGNILALGHETGITQHGHLWSSEVREPTTATTNSKTELGATKQTGSYASTLTGLKPGTTYYVRAYARNQYGTSYGQVLTFTTAVGEVRLTTSSVTDIVHNEATCGGRITDLGGNTITERGVCWNTAANPTLAHHHAASNDRTDNFSARLTNLTEQTTYHVRAYVTTANGETYYGQDVMFTTTNVITNPAVSVTTVSSITSKGATFTATVTSTGGGTVKRSGFCIATTPAPTTANTVLSCGTATSLSASTTALSAETTYYVRAFVENEKGLVYGSEVNFKTKEKATGSVQREDWGSDENWN